MDEESKNILIESINDANRILEKYNYELRYCQYDIHFEKPLKPTLFIKNRRKNVQYGLIRHIIEDNILIFYLGDLNVESSNLTESKINVQKIKDLLKDIEDLNNLLLFVDDKLTSLES